MPPKTTKGKIRKTLTGDGRKKPSKFVKENAEKAFGKSKKK
ncbi:hypothetical protein J2127_000990 [Methanococcus voltae]|uniref:Uncharacterized protein n=2 Tax=Methanococcus voltae TaxID=2188 RepID=A0A8J7RIP9_METVO|nr:hypothetical protein [Methanococcus voltae]MBP2143822.1 hypothetical protein [Methanococcus voltae]MBP2202180.1 hypothetical protein [Methanococcus voltae]MCS3922573.1 hypothetical protein [Methanococcus voltae PS]